MPAPEPAPDPVDDISDRLGELGRKPLHEWTDEDGARLRQLLSDFAVSAELAYRPPESVLWRRFPGGVAANAKRAGRHWGEADYDEWLVLMNSADYSARGAASCDRRLRHHFKVGKVPREVGGIAEHDIDEMLRHGDTALDVWRDLLLDENGRSRMREFVRWSDPAKAPAEIHDLVNALNGRLEEPSASVVTGQVMANFLWNLLFARIVHEKGVYPKLDSYCLERARKMALDWRVVRPAGRRHDDEAAEPEPANGEPVNPEDRPPEHVPGRRPVREAMRWLDVYFPGLAASLRDLPPSGFRVLASRLFLELEGRDIATSLGTTENNVRQIAHRAKLQLKACLRDLRYPDSREDRT